MTRTKLVWFGSVWFWLTLSFYLVWSEFFSISQTKSTCEHPYSWLSQLGDFARNPMGIVMEPALGRPVYEQNIRHHGGSSMACRKRLLEANGVSVVQQPGVGNRPAQETRNRAAASNKLGEDRGWCGGDDRLIIMDGYNARI